MDMIPNFVGPDVPRHLLLKVGNFNATDWEIVLDQRGQAEITRGELALIRQHLDVAMRTIGWMMCEEGLHEFLYTPELDAKLRGKVQIVMDHSITADPMWRFTVIQREE